MQAIRENETRMEALGYPVFRYRLVCFALGGACAGLAGALLANQSGLASPSLLQWTQSGTLLVMVIIGGVGYLYRITSYNVCYTKLLRLAQRVILDRRAAHEVVEVLGKGADGMPGGEFGDAGGRHGGLQHRDSR